MNQKSIGETISRLRKRQGMTQAALAEKLKVSDKTISKWENGLGFPEVTQFPTLAELFGISIDFLMTGERKGIAVAGNILTDIVMDLDCYPEVGMLATISKTSRAVGGCMPNTGIDLAKIDRSIPIYGIGMVGDDDNGRFVLSTIQQNGIDISGIRIVNGGQTSFSNVMSLPTGERTFFHAPALSAVFSPDDVDLSSLNCSMLHAGYIFLLPQFDAEDPVYGTVMARFLHDAQERGIKTSVDMVTTELGDYNAKVIPALRYCDNIVVNEIEACSTFGVKPYDENGRIIPERIREVAEKMVEAGVRERVIIHCKQAGFCYNAATKQFTVVPSLKIPSSEIKGSVGAGDAFCAGCLYGIYNDYDDKQLLEFASAAAASSLFAANSVDGMLPKHQLTELDKKYGRRSLC